MEDKLYVSIIELNQDISFHEIEYAISKLKEKKALGIDLVPNEVPKSRSVNLVLYRLFCLCFNLGKTPTIWQKALIKQIPKVSNKDPYVPLNYRGITLISCISKLYTSCLNSSIVRYCNILDIFPDEQNGFRQNHYCEDHIFSLTSIVKNHIAEKKNIFCLNWLREGIWLG